MGLIRIPLLLAVILTCCQARSSSEEMVAFMCNKPAMVHTEKGWLEDHSTDCIRDPVKILEYCQKKFPNVKVTNVVKASEKVTIKNWCGFDKNKCHKHNQHEVTPFRCLVGAFQSDALLVPEHCLFDHKHGDRCLAFDTWNSTAISMCSGRDMKLASFAILQPCGINVFSGVEFVCCPRKPKAIAVMTTDMPTPTSTSAPSTPKLVEVELKKPTDEQLRQEENFYSHYLAKSNDEHYLNEHEYFMKAKNNLQKHHHEKVTKMMKEWAQARQNVQDMNNVDPKGAEKLNHEITARFQKTYEALEEEGVAEKKQLVALHQQRVQVELNDKKRGAMEHYMDVLRSGSDAEDAPRILKALRHYVKTEQKDRQHTINHYRHMVDADLTGAASIRQQSLDHLRIIDQRLQQAVDMLTRVPAVQKKVRTQIEDYMSTFHEIDVAISQLLIDHVVDDVHSSTAKSVPEPTDNSYEEYYNEDDYEDEDEDENDYDDDDEDEAVDEVTTEDEQDVMEPKSTEEQKPAIQLKPTDFDDEVDEDERDLPELQPAHMEANRLEVHIQEKDVPQSKAANALYQGYTLAIAVAAIAVFVILVAGIVVLRRRTAASAAAAGNHGFVEIDQAASPEERHVTNMQMNGYENPTYKYFEVNANA